MTSRFKSGERVVSSHLGAGTVVKPRTFSNLRLVTVQFDKTPPFEYNCCQNPTVEFEDALTPETPITSEQHQEYESEDERAERMQKNPHLATEFDI